MKERMELALKRLAEIENESILPGDWQDFFVAQAAFLLLLADVYSGAEQPGEGLNERLYKDILPENYSKSFADPAYATERFGAAFGPLLSMVAAELRSGIGAAFEKEEESLLIRMELCLQLYAMAEGSFSEDKKAPEYEHVRAVVYDFVSDYFETECALRCKKIVDPSCDFAVRIITESDLSNASYLYRYGEYITENEIKLAEYMAALPDERIALMADTFTEGYRKGFITTGKDLSKKKSVDIRFPLGMERMVKRAIENFEKLGLKPVIYRAGGSIFTGRSVSKNGFFGANPNRQYDDDHKEDLALFLDAQLMNRRLECIDEGFKAVKELAGVHAGPAVIEEFGGAPFVPEKKTAAPRYSDAQRALDVRFRTENIRITYTYIPGEERSFTIIAFPVPAIGDNFKEIFDATIRINTLDYTTYQRIQMLLIAALNDCEYMHVVGAGENKTELKVALQKPKDKDKQAIFENCVADVNIPVGEVFTSPKLSGTNGVLNVSRVFLNGLEYKDLSLVFKDGMVADYSCANFPDDKQNKAYIEENVLFHHKSLPMGEAAIGTNTTAYVLGRKYGIEALLPILIAEKTGPHFAVGDTCYSHAEDVPVYNPDGKEIFARDNEVSILRKTEPARAYFGCHTDVTLPYDELGLLEGIREDGSSIELIRNGRFVLGGCEELNKVFEEE